ncbi:MAG: hypothetical protein Fur0043_15670 [Anaerolineales bacterium]
MGIYSPFDSKPGLVKAIAVLTLVNGIVNIFWGLAATATVTASVILLCLAPFTILPTILGVFEILYALKLLAEPMRPVWPSQTLAILEILCILTGNAFSMVVGILALVFYNDPQVKDFFAHLNGLPYPLAPQPAPSAPPASPEPAPVTPASPSAPADSPAPSSEKKPRRRKVADAIETDTPPA